MSQEKPRVLLVDDEPSIIKTVGKRLEAAGYEVMLAMDGQDGLAKAQTAHPDVIILDLMMPWVSGFEVCAVLKKDPRCQHIPIIIYSGTGQADDARRCQELGADAYVPKTDGAAALLAHSNVLLKRPAAKPGPQG
jgi:two-component system phosphate regulon response regulator PhoB